MIDSDLKEINPTPQASSFSPEHVNAGLPIPKEKRVQLFSPDEWECFTEEWALTLISQYRRVAKFAGAGDKGLDVVCFTTSNGFLDVWDNFQCKHYDHALRPSDIWVEIGKIIYYSFVEEYNAPRKYYFIAPLGIGTKLQGLLSNKEKLKSELKKHWASNCEEGITSKSAIKLSGKLEEYFESFDFGIFSTISVSKMVDEHSKSTFHSVRFGGGLPLRPESITPPKEIEVKESRYIRQILNAYADHYGEIVSSHEWCDSDAAIKKDFLKQRERFYHAESLRNFSRDTVPEGTFESLQNDIYDSVVDTCESIHPSGLERMKRVLNHSTMVSITSNPLLTVVRPIDKQGICHQLANTDRLKWVENE